MVPKSKIVFGYCTKDSTSFVAKLMLWGCFSILVVLKLRAPLEQLMVVNTQILLDDINLQDNNKLVVARTLFVPLFLIRASHDFHFTFLEPQLFSCFYQICQKQVVACLQKCCSVTFPNSKTVFGYCTKVGSFLLSKFHFGTTFRFWSF